MTTAATDEKKPAVLAAGSVGIKCSAILTTFSRVIKRAWHWHLAVGLDVVACLAILIVWRLS